MIDGRCKGKVGDSSKYICHIGSKVSKEGGIDFELHYFLYKRQTLYGDLHSHTDQFLTL